VRRDGAQAAVLAGNPVQGLRLVHHRLRPEVVIRSIQAGSQLLEYDDRLLVVRIRFRRKIRLGFRREQRAVEERRVERF
jgi:hypothetical protein